jgi:hypothetical protein
VDDKIYVEHSTLDLTIGYTICPLDGNFRQEVGLLLIIVAAADILV